MQERQEREQRMKEELKRELSVQPVEYERKKKALEEELRKVREREREILMRAGVKIEEKMLELQKSVQVSRTESTRNARLLRRLSTSTTSSRSSRSSATVDALAAASGMLKAEELLRVVREMNPELEARRQAALRVSAVLSCVTAG